MMLCKSSIMCAFPLVLILGVLLWVKSGRDKYDRAIALERSPNHHIVRKNKKGEIYSEKSKTNGLSHGVFVDCSPDNPNVGIHGQFLFGVRTGEWTYDYSDGTLMRREFFGNPYCITSDWSGTISWVSDLLNGEYYSPDGSLYSIVSNRVGIISNFSRTVGEDPAMKYLEWMMVGFATNYSVTYYLNSFHQFAVNAEHVDFFPILRCSSPTFHCYFGKDGEVWSIRQWDEEGRLYDMVFGENGEVEYDNGRMPPFLLGSPIVIPSYENGRLRFNVQITFTNGVATLSHIVPKEDDIQIMPCLE